MMSASDTALATFTPQLEVSQEDTAPGIPADYTVRFGLPQGDVNFGGVVAFLPNDWGIVPGSEVPVGAVVGTLHADATLGLIGGPCNQELPVEFTMLNASLDQSDSFEFEVKDGGGDPNVADWAEDNNDDGLIGAIEQWPAYVFRALDKTEAQPIRRAAGMAIVASTPVLLQFLIFPPGTFINENIPNDPEFGYPSVTLLQNAGDPDIIPEPGVITDFCTPLFSTNTSFGVTQDNEDTEGTDESGYPLFVNPQDGTYTFTIASVGLRDADGDGFENTLDTCPLEPNIGNPRVPNEGDGDSDGLDAACDPNDDQASGGTNSDQDGDGYLNRGDNCPTLANGEELTNQADQDEDQIGDVCDPNPDSADTEGTLSVDETSFDLVIGSGTGEGGAPDCSGLAMGVSCFDAGGSTEPTDGATGGPADDGGGDGGSSNTGLIVGIVAAIIAAIVIIGGGAALMMRRGGSA